MNRRLLRLVGALLALVAVVAVLAVTLTGLVGLLLALVLTGPWSPGRLVAASMTTGGLALLVFARLLDPQAVPHALDRVRAVSASLAATVASRGRQ